MGTQVLTGSEGLYRPVNATEKEFGDCRFTVTEDTCLEATKLPVKFYGAAEPCLVDMSRVTFTKKTTKDYL